VGAPAQACGYQKMLFAPVPPFPLFPSLPSCTWERSLPSFLRCTESVFGGSSVGRESGAHPAFSLKYHGFGCSLKPEWLIPKSPPHPRSQAPAWGSPLSVQALLGHHLPAAKFMRKNPRPCSGLATCQRNVAEFCGTKRGTGPPPTAPRRIHSGTAAKLGGTPAEVKGTWQKVSVILSICYGTVAAIFPSTGTKRRFTRVLVAKKYQVK